MKKIIDGKLYDTEKATLIIGFRRKGKAVNIFGGKFETWAESKLYKTINGNWFEIVGIDFKDPQWSVISENSAKEIIQVANPDLFCEMYPDEVEEA